MAEKRTSKLKYLIRTRSLIRFLVNKRKIRILNEEVSKYSDYEFIKKRFLIDFGYEPNLNNPKTFNENILWLKLYWRDNLAKICVDKCLVKEYLKELGFGDYLVPTYGVYNSVEEIDFNKLPRDFVIKVNSDSGGVAIIRNGLNIDDAVLKIKKSFDDINYFTFNKEWVYEGIEKKILIEKIIETKNNETPTDYKFFCFNGEPKFLFVGSNRDTDIRFDFFDLEWNHIPVMNGHLNAKITPKKPENLKEMISFCRSISKPFPAVRVDLYSENNKIYFGEFTFFHFSGFVPFYPKKYDEIFGKYFDHSKGTKRIINNISVSPNDILDLFKCL